MLLNSCAVYKGEGNTITLMTRVDYIEKMNKYTNKEFIELKKDLTNKFQQNFLQAIWESTSLFSPSEIFSLNELNPQPPVLYGLPKLHKQDIPLKTSSILLPGPVL